MKVQYATGMLLGDSTHTVTHSQSLRVVLLLLL